LAIQKPASPKFWLLHVSNTTRDAVTIKFRILRPRLNSVEDSIVMGVYAGREDRHDSVPMESRICPLLNGRRHPTSGVDRRDIVALGESSSARRSNPGPTLPETGVVR